MTNSKILCSLLVLVLVNCVTHAADCDKAKNPDDGEISSFFKNVGCKIYNGAEQVAEAAKPIATSIGKGAKEFGSSVAEKYDQLKHSLSDEAPKPSPQTQVDTPTERVLLAPIAPAVPADIANPQPIAG